MCAIVDNNLAGLFFGRNVAPDLKPLLKWIALQDGRLVVGGQLRRELESMVAAVNLMNEWRRSRKLRVIPDDLIDAECGGDWAVHVRSNDHQILALARVAGARILATAEKTGAGNLSADFKDVRIISSPRGFVYTKAEHATSLGHSGSCGLPKSGVWKSRR